MTHDLKTVNPYFDEVWEGKKTFEVRYNDRTFKEGDTVILREYSRSNGYSGRKIKAKIGYVLEVFIGLTDGFVAFSLINTVNYETTTN